MILKIAFRGLLAMYILCQGVFAITIPPDLQKIIDDLKPVSIKADRQAALPTRVCFPTFASQNGYIAAAQLITDHLDQKRFVPKPLQGSHRVALGQTGEELTASNKATLRSCLPKRCKQEDFTTGWLGVFGEYAHEKPQPDIAAFTFNVGGAVAGFDYNCADDNVVGFGASYVYSRVNDDADAGDANVNQGLWGFYSKLQLSDIYFNLGLFGGYYHTNQVRNIPIGDTLYVALSNTHGWQLAPHAEIGYDGYLSHICHFQRFGIGPFILGDWVANWEHGFSEHGADLLNTRQQGRFCSLFRGETGVRFHEIINYSWGYLVFQEKGSYAYQKMFGTGTVYSALPALPSSGFFTTKTLKSAQNLAVFEFSVLFKPLKRSYPYGNLRYQGQFGSKFQTHQGIVEIGKDF